MSNSETASRASVDPTPGRAPNTLQILSSLEAVTRDKEALEAEVARLAAANERTNERMENFMREYETRAGATQDSGLTDDETRKALQRKRERDIKESIAAISQFNTDSTETDRETFVFLWESLFQRAPTYFDTDQEKVMAATHKFAPGDMQARWRQYVVSRGSEDITWDDLKEFLYHIVHTDAGVRADEKYAYTRLGSQKATQPFAEFARLLQNALPRSHIEPTMREQILKLDLVGRARPALQRKLELRRSQAGYQEPDTVANLIIELTLLDQEIGGYQAEPSRGTRGTKRGANEPVSSMAAPVKKIAGSRRPTSNAPLPEGQLCYNCGKGPHRWDQCRQPLKPELQARKDARAAAVTASEKA